MNFDFRSGLLIFIAILITGAGSVMLVVDPEHNFVAAFGVYLSSIPLWCAFVYSLFGSYHKDERKMFAKTEEEEKFLS